MTSDIITAVVFLAACGILLSVLLVLAERFILNFGPCEIDINNGEKKLTVQGGGSLLSLLAQQNIFIPSACGGRGNCGYCKVAVTAGGGEINPVEDPSLSAEEKERSIRLACQVKVRTNIAITIPREYFSAKKYRGKVLSKTLLTYDITALRIALLEPTEIEFTAGQYAQLESREYKGRESVMRAYSISSVPSDRNHVDFMIRLVPGGICSTWIFEHLTEGQNVQFSGPYGDFKLRETDAPILFVAGGSGMAPILSMLQTMKESGNTRKAVYCFGARTQADLFMTKELQQLEQDLPGFTFVPALSNEPAESGWKGETGLITDVVARRVPDASTYEAYLCGSPGMINACIATLTKCGMVQEKIFYDKFA